MESLMSSSSPLPFTPSERAALINLLTDEDVDIYRLVRERILEQGKSVAEWMRSFSLSNDPVLRRRTREIAQYFDKQDYDNDFLGFCLSHGEDLNLEYGCWLLSRARRPEINIEGYRAMLDSLAGRLLDRVDFGAEPEGILADINQFLFNELGYCGDEDYANSERCFHLADVIDRRKGSPVTVSMIYLFVCRRLRLPVTGIGIPGHFLCRFQTTREEIYIDAFNGGRLLTKSACVSYLKQSKRQYDEKFLAPASPRRMLLRVCTQLMQIYADTGDEVERARLQRYVVALSN